MSKCQVDETLVTFENDGDIESSSLRKTCSELLKRNQFVDVTLSCVDGQVQAHRLVLCSTSPYLFELFTSNPSSTPCTHPMVILRDCKVTEVQLTLEYIYNGKTQAKKNQLASLLNAAKELGCESLEKSVSEALEAIPSSVVPKANPHVTKIGGGIQSLFSQITKAITIKQEKEEERKEAVTSRKRSRSNSPTIPQPITATITTKSYSIPPMPKLLRMTPASSKRILTPDSGPSSPPILTRMGQPSSPLEQDLRSCSPSLEFDDRPRESVLLQHDKAESFVYTNENLDMMMYGDDEDEDPNESDNDRFGEAGKFVQENLTPVATEVDEKVSLCPWCSQPFDSVVLLQQHIKTHVAGTVNKPFLCPYCTHVFARSAHLKRHVRTHTGEKPYKCKHCDREFSRQDKMKIHVSRHVQGTLPVTNNGGSNYGTNNSMVRTSYPPPAISQSSCGQVPIKILIPTNQGGHSSKALTTTNGMSVSTVDMPRALSPSTFFASGLTPSIMINAIPPNQPATVISLQSRHSTTGQLNFVVN